MVILSMRKCQEMFHFQEKESPEETTEESVKDGVWSRRPCLHQWETMKEMDQRRMFGVRNMMK